MGESVVVYVVVSGGESGGGPFFSSSGSGKVRLLSSVTLTLLGKTNTSPPLLYLTLLTYLLLLPLYYNTASS